MAKPVTDPRWIATGEIAAPSTPKQDAGFAVGERPPSQYFNWFMNLVYQWCLYLKNFGDHAQVFTEQVTLNNTVFVQQWNKLTYEEREKTVQLKHTDASSTGVVFNTTEYSYEVTSAGAAKYIIIPLEFDYGDFLSVVGCGFDYAGGTGASSTDIECALVVVAASSVTTYSLDGGSLTTGAAWTSVDDTFTGSATIPNKAQVFLRFDFTANTTNVNGKIRRLRLKFSNT